LSSLPCDGLHAAFEYVFDGTRAHIGRWVAHDVERPTHDVTGAEVAHYVLVREFPHRAYVTEAVVLGAGQPGRWAARRGGRVAQRTGYCTTRAVEIREVLIPNRAGA